MICEKCGCTLHYGETWCRACGGVNSFEGLSYMDQNGIVLLKDISRNNYGRR